MVLLAESGMNTSCVILESAILSSESLSLLKAYFEIKKFNKVSKGKNNLLFV